MRKIKPVLLIAAACLLLAVAVICYVMYKPHRDINRETPVIITAVDLVEAYRKDEADANRRFLDKVLQVAGTVDGTETDNDGRTVVILSGTTPMSDVRCTLQKNITAESGTEMTLKGRCTGYLSDVILVDCLSIE